MSAGAVLSGNLLIQSLALEQRRDAPETLLFSMAFQPIVNLPARRIVSHEALVRGPAGEGAAMVLAQVDAAHLHAFDQVCQIRAIEVAARSSLPGRVDINVLPHAVHEPQACVRTTLAVAERSGIDPARLTFDMVQTSAPECQHLGRIVREYRRGGAKIALDDFASGSSSLLRLAELEPDFIKIDRRLVRDCDRDHKRLSIIAGIIRLSNAIGTAVVVKGVERPAEAEALLSVGARLMQGFLFSRPIFEDFCHPAFIFGGLHATSEAPRQSGAGCFG